MVEMFKEVEVLKIEQSEIDVLVDDLIDQIKRGAKRYSKVVGIRNGGIHISTKIAEALLLPHESVRISFYNYDLSPPDSNGNAAVVPKMEEEYRDFDYLPDILLVDDLVDNGHTISRFFQKFGVVDTAVVYWKINNKNKIKPTYFGALKPDRWLVFPWEGS